MEFFRSETIYIFYFDITKLLSLGLISTSAPTNKTWKNWILRIPATKISGQEFISI